MAKKNNSPIGVGMTAKQMKRKRPINSDLLNKIEPITDNQKILFDNYKEGKNTHCTFNLFSRVDLITPLCHSLHIYSVTNQSVSFVN